MSKPRQKSDSLSQMADRLSGVMFRDTSQPKEQSDLSSRLKEGLGKLEQILFRTAPEVQPEPAVKRPSPRPASSSRPKPVPTLRQIHMQTLGLTGTPDIKAIRAAYLRLAQQFHPDRFSKSTYTDSERRWAGMKMGEINEAYAWLRQNSRAPSS